jgi:hypothetical protein
MRRTRIAIENGTSQTRPHSVRWDDYQGESPDLTLTRERCVGYQKIHETVKQNISAHLNSELNSFRLKKVRNDGDAIYIRHII